MKLSTAMEAASAIVAIGLTSHPPPSRTAMRSTSPAPSLSVHAGSSRQALPVRWSVQYVYSSHQDE